MSTNKSAPFSRSELRSFPFRTENKILNNKADDSCYTINGSFLVCIKKKKWHTSHLSNKAVSRGGSYEWKYCSCSLNLKFKSSFFFYSLMQQKIKTNALAVLFTPQWKHRPLVGLPSRPAQWKPALAHRPPVALVHVPPDVSKHSRWNVSVLSTQRRRPLVTASLFLHRGSLTS